MTVISGGDFAYAVSRRPLSSRAQAYPYEIFGRISGTGNIFSDALWF